MGRWQDEAYFRSRGAGTVPYHSPRFTDLYEDDAWDGEDVWIIGGGPSVKTHDLSLLRGRKVIAVNMGFTVCEPTFIFVGSVMLLQRLCGRLGGGKGVVLDINCPMVVHERAVWNLKSSMGGYVLEVPENINASWGKKVREGVPAFSNSGIMAVNIADLLGARRIFLIGFDMRAAEDGKTANFHKLYPDHMRPPGSHYENYMKDFERVPKHCKAEVVNCTPDSRMKIFPHMSYAESLRI